MVPMNVSPFFAEYNGGSPGSGQNLETEGKSNGGPHTGVLYKKSVSEQSYHKRDAETASEKHNQPSYNKHPTGDHHDARGHVDEGHHGPKQNPEGPDHQGSRRYTSAELKDGRRHEHHPDHHRSGEETGSHQRSSHENSSEKDIHHNHPDGKRYDKADHGSHEGAEEKTYASRESQGGHSGKHRVGKGEDGGQRRYELGAEKGAQSHEGHDENTHTSNEGSSGESHGAARRNGKGATERYGSEEGSGREATAMINPSQIDTHLHDIPRDRHSRRKERDGNVHHHAGASPDLGRDHPLTVLPSPVDLPEYHEPATQHGKHHKRGHHHGQGRHKAFRGPRGRHGTYHPTGHVRTARVTHRKYTCLCIKTSRHNI